MKTQTFAHPFKQHFNEIIHIYFSHPLHGEEVPEIPEDPIDWLMEHFLGMEAVPLVSVLIALTLRSATPGTCGRYARTRDVELPFIGGEQAVFDVMLDTLLERGYDISHVVRVVEMLALVVANAGRVIGIHPMSPLSDYLMNTSQTCA